MKPLTRVIVSRNGFASAEPYDLVSSNLKVVNLLRDEEYPMEQITPESRASYWVDYYDAQMKNGGFPQFVYNSRWNQEVVRQVEGGLERMGAGEHLALFRELASRVAALPPEELAAFFARDLFGKNETRDRLESNAFFELTGPQDLVGINSAYLRALPNLDVLSIDDMFIALEQVLGRPIER